MTKVGKWIAAIALWFVYGLMVGLIIAWGDPRRSTIILAAVGAVSYAALITLLFFGRRTL